MKIALTGTPGTGKTTIAKILTGRYGLKVVDLNEVVRTHRYYTGWDEQRECLIVDLEALRAHQFLDDLVFEGHLSHVLPVDRVIVLRTNPVALRSRLQKKAFSEKKINENVEAEILDSILIEALAQHGDKVYEVDSTGAPSESAQLVWEIIQGRGLERFVVGKYDWTAYLNDA
jgi:adenylate kinase